MDSAHDARDLQALEGDFDLMIPEKAMHYAIATRAEADPSKHEELVIQYEVKYEMGVSCSGSYIKLLLAPFEDLGDLKDGVPYSVMFGPDKCGSNDRVHFIFQVCLGSALSLQPPRRILTPMAPTCLHK